MANEEFKLNLTGTLAKAKSTKQINKDIRELEKVINTMRLTGTFAKGSTKKELNNYVMQLSGQLSTLKLKAKIDNRELKKEVDSALNSINFKEIEALHIDENKTKLKIRKVIADVKAYAEKTPISVNVEIKRNRLGNDLTTYLNKNTKIKESAVLLEEADKVRALIESAGDKKSLREATDAFQLFKSEVSATGYNTKSVTDKIKSMFGHITKISSVLGLASVAVNSFTKSLATLKSNDTILTEISKTSEMTKRQLQELGDEAFKIASKYGQLSSDYLLGVQEMARSGYEETSKELGELSLLAQSAGNMTADSANNYILATDAAYKYSGSIEKLAAALDGANYISNRNSASLSDIADATRVSASFAANAEVAIDELTAAEATMLAVTKRGGSEIGRAFRSIILNLQQVSGEFDGEVIDEEQLKKVEARCHSLGVELETLKDGVATLRNPMEVLKELADAYNSLPDNSAEKQGLISDLGGKYHANSLSALLSRWDLYEKMLGEFSQGTGSALEEANKTADSWEGRLNSLTNSFTSFVNTLTNKEAVLDGITFFDRLIQGAEGLTKTVGEIPLVLTTLNTALTAINKDYGITQVVNKDTGKLDVQGKAFGIDFTAIKKQKKHFEEAAKAITHWNRELETGNMDLDSFNNKCVKNNAQLKDYLSTTSVDAPASLSGYKAHLNAAGVSTDSLRLKTILLNSALSVGIGFAVQTVLKGITYLIQRQENLRQATEEAASAYKQSASSISDYVARYQELHTALLAAKGNEEETYQVKSQLLDLQKELNEKYGEEYGYLNLVTNAYRDQADEIKNLNKESAQRFLNEHYEGIEKAEREITEDKHYNLSGAYVNQNSREGQLLKEIAEEYKDSGVTVNDGMDGTFSIHLKADAQSAHEVINDFMTDVKERAEQMGMDIQDNIDLSGVAEMSSLSLENANKIIDKYGEIFQQAQMAQIVSDDNLSKGYHDALSAVEAYNEAVLKSENPYQDKAVKRTWENLQTVRQGIMENESEWLQYAGLLEDLFSTANDKVYTFYQALQNDTSISGLAENLRGLSDIDLQSMYDDGDNGDAFDRLIAKAKEYGVETQDVIDLLKELGTVQGEVQDFVSDVTPPSFIEAFDSADFAEAREKLLELAQAGELSDTTLTSTEEYVRLLDQTGISAKDAATQIRNMLTEQEKLSAASQGINSLKASYEEFKDIGFVTAQTLESLPEVFKDLPEYDVFSHIVGNPESGKAAIQNAFNEIVSAYLLSQNTLSGLVNASESTIQTYIANLRQMGITNAEEVINQVVTVLNTESELICAAEEEYYQMYLNYIMGKETLDNTYLNSTASKNGQLAAMLGSAYQQDYNNWCDLLSKKAIAYNDFITALGGSYDSSKDIASIIDRLKYFDFDSSAAVRSKYYKAMGGEGTYDGTPAQNAWMINEMKKNGFQNGGRIGNPISQAGEDGMILARTGEEVLSLEKLEAIRDAALKFNPVLDRMDALFKMPEFTRVQEEQICNNNINVTFNMPNVSNYNEFFKQMQRDTRFEKMVQHMTLGNALGRNSFNKYKV